MAADASSVGFFSFISDDVVLNILAKLESDPRDWARLACVSVKFASLVRNMYYQLSKSWSFGWSELLSEDPGSCAALYKLSVCCPGLAHAGVLLESSDFGLEREIGPDDQKFRFQVQNHASSTNEVECSSSALPECWSMFDDLYFDTVYDASEAQMPLSLPTDDPMDGEGEGEEEEAVVSLKRKREWVGPVKAHLASGSWKLSREQGNKLLASRFRGDSLYICEWPGCVHMEERRKYMLFRGVFKNFSKSRVWRTINDNKGPNRGKTTGIDCAFCECRDTWDLHSAFCLRTTFGFHDDGEPVVRAYVCRNGHVSGAWTEGPVYA